MGNRSRPATRLPTSRWLTVCACFCVVLSSPFPQIAGLARNKTTECETSGKTERECADETLVVCSAARRRVADRRGGGPDSAMASRVRPRRVDATRERIRAIVGHQLANGLNAPLLI